MKTFSVVIIALLIAKFISAQDRLVFKTGDEKLVKVLEIGTDEIKYKKQDDGPLYVVKKRDVFMIVYFDGSKDVFNEQEEIKKEEPKNIIKEVPLEVPKEIPKEVPKEVQKPTLKEPVLSKSELYKMGRDDAMIYYRGQNSGAGGTFFTSIFLSSLLGLVPAIACSSTPPNNFNLHMPLNDVSENRYYISGYQDQAHRKKKNKIWTLWGLGLGLNVVAYFIYTQPN